MYERAILPLALVLTICMARGARAAEPQHTEVNVVWMRLSETDRGWEIENIRELGDWNLPIHEGDVLTHIEGQDASKLGPISMAAFVEDALGQWINVAVEREGRTQNLNVFAGGKDQLANTKRFYEQYGVGLVLTSGPPGGGATVARVMPDSPAKKSELRKDDKILAVDGKDVSAPQFRK
jgi:PDZ domain